MTEETPANADSFDLERLRELFEMMEKHGLTEVDLRNGPERWRLRRGPGEFAAAPMLHFPPPALAAAPAAPVSQPATTVPAAKPPESDSGGLVIKSPTVGTFYLSSTPDDPPFVSVGSKVAPDTIVCIVEAMKVFNQIPAEVSGTITAVLVKNGDAVEYGQPLFKVSPG